MEKKIVHCNIHCIQRNAISKIKQFQTKTTFSDDDLVEKLNILHYTEDIIHMHKNTSGV